MGTYELIAQLSNMPAWAWIVIVGGGLFFFVLLIFAARYRKAGPNEALNIFGGYGLMNEFPVQRYLRDSYFPLIGGGTSDIMRLLVARQLGL